MLEPYDGKLSRTVLRREGARKSPALSGHQSAQKEPRNKLSVLNRDHRKNASRA